MMMFNIMVFVPSSITSVAHGVWWWLDAGGGLGRVGPLPRLATARPSQSPATGLGDSSYSEDQLPVGLWDC